MKKKIFQHLRRWHRRLGISAAIFILFLSVSGIILNHSDDLNLPHSFIKSEIIWNLYGIKEPDEIIVYEVSHKKIIAVDEQLWLDDTLLLTDAGRLKSAVFFNGIIVAAINNELVLMTMDGEIIERLDSSAGIPANINYLATSTDKIWAETNNGFFVSDEQLLQWQVAETHVSFKKTLPITLSKADEEKVISNFNAQIISWERLLLDIHSGRILGNMGPLFSDLVALLLILLSLSGIYMWIRSTKVSRGKNKQRS